MSAVWSGFALEEDPRLGEFQRDPAGYMEERARIIRSGNFQEEQARILRQKNERLKTLLTRLLRRRSRA